MKDFHNSMNLLDFRALVIMSANWNFVSQCCNSIALLLNWSHNKWNLVSMCLLLPCDTKFFAKSIADLLSTNNFIAWSVPIVNSLRSVLSQRAWQAVKQVEMYSAS